MAKNILSYLRRTVTTTTDEVIEDLTAASSTPDAGFDYGNEGFFSSFDYVEDEDQETEDDATAPAPAPTTADRDFPINVELDVDGSKSNWSYGSVEELSRRLVATQDFYNRADKVVLTITKR